MKDIEKNELCGIEIFDFTGKDYKKAMSFENWRVAYLNYGDEFNLTLPRLERHMETDEAFILLTSTATLVIGEELNRIDMEPFKVYNVPRAVWHHIQVDEGTRVLIIENEDTSKANTEYIYF